MCLSFVSNKAGKKVFKLAGICCWHILIVFFITCEIAPIILLGWQDNRMRVHGGTPEPCWALRIIFTAEYNILTTQLRNTQRGRQAPTFSYSISVTQAPSTAPFRGTRLHSGSFTCHLPQTYPGILLQRHCRVPSHLYDLRVSSPLFAYISRPI